MLGFFYLPKINNYSDFIYFKAYYYFIFTKKVRKNKG